MAGLAWPDEAAGLYDVDAEVDDHVACIGVMQIMEPHAPGTLVDALLLIASASAQ